MLTLGNGRHDTQPKDTRHNNTARQQIEYDIQHNGTQQMADSVVRLCH
jgi:hypothetical protein